MKDGITKPEQAPEMKQLSWPVFSNPGFSVAAPPIDKLVAREMTVEI